MAETADRNLLVGILAVQLDFITRDQLIAAMNVWVLNKSRTLDEILREQDALGDDTHELLKALVRKHLQLHDDDPQKSLGSLSTIGALRKDLKSIADPEIDMTLTAVSANTGVADRGSEASIPVGAAASGGPRFRVLRPHAKGGLGEVFVAQDEELRREVALKEIQRRFADDHDRRARFTLEAEITGGLEHPGIVPVYGLGHYSDGRPFYAMRFIRGHSLKEAIERFHTGQRSETEDAVEFRKLVGRFIDVCDAIEYAHSRGVLHRDLKPGNIMLGKYGETLVVDWGLAKTVESRQMSRKPEEPTLQPSSNTGSAPTQMGSAMGTPAYMSPEQAEGRIDELDATSDVYNLGATLYCLLCGKPPFAREDLDATLGKVKRGEFPAPCSVNPGIPRPLEAICLKAMALHREHRYQSPHELSEDLEHWLADEPVRAFQEGIVTRVGRWMRHHRNWVVSGAVALVLVAAVSIVAVALIHEKRVIAVRLAHEKEHLRQKEEVARKEAERLARESQHRFNQVRELANTFIFDVHDRIASLQGSTPARQFLVETGLSLMFDCEATGDDGAKEALWLLAQRRLDVRLAWSQAMHGGQFVGRQPESLTGEEWDGVIRPAIAR
jgi:serine/threonine-protein kinase